MARIVDISLVSGKSAANLLVVPSPLAVAIQRLVDPAKFA